MPKNAKIIQRNNAIRKKYIFYTETKHLNSEYTLTLLEKEFLPLEKSTIWLIVTKTGFYKDY